MKKESRKQKAKARVKAPSNVRRVAEARARLKAEMLTLADSCSRMAEDLRQILAAGTRA